MRKYHRKEQQILEQDYPPKNSHKKRIFRTLDGRLSPGVRLLFPRIKVSDVARVPKGTYKRGAIRNVTFENITATDCFSYVKNRRMPSVIWGKPGSPIEGIKFKNVTITAKGGHRALESSLDPKENDERFPRHVDAIPAYAWYLRHVKNIRFLNCRFGYEKNDDRPAMVVDDGINVTLDECYLQGGSNCDSRVVTRNGAEIIHVQGKAKDYPLEKLGI